jgi:hypothetical protein
MALVFDEKYRNNIGCRITIRIGQAIKDGELPEEEIKEICAYVLVAIQDIKTEDEFSSFCFLLSARWPFLKQLTEEEIKKIHTADSIENMFQNRSLQPTA